MNFPGFFSLPEPELEVPGNAGLKDIVMALKWLKQNNIKFNGDANNVTLFGHSSGGSCTHLLSISPQCEGLFHKAILLSGLYVEMKSIPNVNYRFAKHVGYEGPEDNQKILNYLLSLEPEKLCHLDLLTQAEKEMGISHTFCPSKENACVPDAIITKDQFEVFAEKQAWSQNMPLMLGGTSFEMLLSYKSYKENPELLEHYKKHPEHLIAYTFLNKYDLAAQKRLAEKILKLHLGDKQICFENVMDVIRLNSYDFTYHPFHCYLNTRVRFAQAPTYLYRFDFDSPDFNLNRIRRLGREMRGVAHVDDLGYLFIMPDTFKLARDSENFKTITRMIDLFTTFAAKSDPNNDGLKPTIWEPLSSQGVRKCLNISYDLTFVDWPELEKCKMWDQCFEEVGIKCLGS